MTQHSIAWTTRPTRLGRLLVAASERGVCHVRFGDADEELARGLAAEFAYAALQRDEARAGGFADALARYVEGKGPEPELPLDVRGSRFQRRVWDALRTIARGQRLSYSALAGRIGQPGAARAVARACATNPVALLVPCHRIVPSAGGVGGYRYGSWRKQALLEAEGAWAALPPLTPPGPAALPAPR